MQENQNDLEKAMAQLGAFIKPRENKFENSRSNFNADDRIKRIYMVVPQNQGNVYMVPIKSSTGALFTTIDDVREFRLSMTGDPGQLRWIKLLPKELYSFAKGSPEDVLYDELVVLHNALRQVHANAWRDTARNRNYFLISGFVLSHKDVNGNDLSKHTASMFIFDHKRLALAMNAEIEGQVQMRGSHLWLNNFFSRDHEDRTGFMKLTYQRGEGVKADWTSLVTFSSFSEDNLGLIKDLIPQEQFDKYMAGMEKPKLTFDKSHVEKVGDHVNHLLGVDEISQRFVLDYYQRVKEKAQEVLAKFTKTQEPTPAQYAATPEVPPVKPLPTDLPEPPAVQHEVPPTPEIPLDEDNPF